MSWSRIVLTGLVLALPAGSASAGLIFKKQPKPNPAQRVPDLIVTVKTDTAENKRSAAAAELRQYDPKAFPDIVPILTDVLRNDPKAGVRLEAAQSLSRLRPVSEEAGLALEKAAANDPSFRVRMQARKYLIYYRLAGYHSPKNKDQLPTKAAAGKKGAKKTGNTGEPPLAGPDSPPATGRLIPVPTQEGPKSTPVHAPKPNSPTATLPDVSVAQPLPAGPTRSPAAAPAPVRKETPPPPPAKEQGPELESQW